MFIRKKDGTEIGREKAKATNINNNVKEKEEEYINITKTEMYKYVDYINLELYIKEIYNEKTSNLYSSYMEKLFIYLKNVCKVNKVRYRIFFNNNVEKLMINIEGISYDSNEINNDINNEYNKIKKNR